MLAEQYGYEVSALPADRAPGAAEHLRRVVRKGIRKMAVLGGLCAVCCGVAALPGMAGDTRAVVLVATGTFLLLPLLIMVQVFRTMLREMKVLLAHYHWQVWPCRFENESVSGIDIVLLSPGGDQVAVLNCPATRRYRAMLRERRRVRFAGDPRFGGVVAPLSVMEFGKVTRDEPDLQPGTPDEDELARRAGLYPSGRAPRR
ncbi:hypothetical protein HUT19_36345 [Streptomyces sp. NA02950]|uniref:hypothetical protein n=1 Tax=Streptomyces sp. NA02950 TaxID=2742137 RepID=UPI0015909DBB|nr:hypothetical protein [Streptomyces sp. NA02950]QKV96502.1 hypothetical protein HUT19_36345 [Streptomyces sp. NA02950]